MNKAILIGRLVADPLAGNNPDKPRAAFTLACEERFSKGNQVQFIPCVAWDNLATFVVNHLHKGSLVCVEGRITKRSYISKTTNQNTISFNVTADKINFVNWGNTTPSEQTNTTDNNDVNPSNQNIDINDIFPESGPTNNLEADIQKQTSANFNQDDDLEWFDNLQKNSQKKG